MKQIDWTLMTGKVLELYPQVKQIVSYRDGQWMLLFDSEPDKFLSAFHPLTQLLRKYRLPAPLIVSRRFILTSLDSYPLEWLDIQSDYTNLYGEDDVMATLQFGKDNVRNQIERELRSKWILTREYALRLNHLNRGLYRMMRSSYQALIPVFKGICFLQNVSIPKTTAQLLDSLEEILHTEVKVLRYLSAQQKTPSRALLTNIFHDYLRLLAQCSEWIDNWKTA
ncbi:MAG: hypothetical protein ACE14O_03550 [Candidatus Cloacimonadaceae bacterium]